MKRLRLSGSAFEETCSAETVVPRMMNRSTPALITVRYEPAVSHGPVLGFVRLHRDPDSPAPDRLRSLRAFHLRAQDWAPVARVVTEHAATFSAVPGVDRWRPKQASSP